MNLPDTIRIIPYTLDFLKPARTSRTVMQYRKVYLFEIWKRNLGKKKSGWGEAAPIEGLSTEDSFFYSIMAKRTHIESPLNEMEHMIDYPSLRFGLESARLDYRNGGNRLWYPGPFTRGESFIPINGLIWMGDKSVMLQQIRQKLDDGYSCLKLKIGGIDFDEELELLKYIRNEFPPHDLELRLDANGAFDIDQAEVQLQRLSEYYIHSIEQPIPAGHVEDMAALCGKNIIPIALDEELIGLRNYEEKKALVDAIQPQYLIFKPSLIGGLAETMEYVQLCQDMDIGWWVTSALESNLGLNILAQFCDHMGVECVQGLGTGKLFSNNVRSPLCEKKGRVFFDSGREWGILDI